MKFTLYPVRSAVLRPLALLAAAVGSEAVGPQTGFPQQGEDSPMRRRQGHSRDSFSAGFSLGSALEDRMSV